RTTPTWVSPAQEISIIGGQLSKTRAATAARTSRMARPTHSTQDRFGGGAAGGGGDSRVRERSAGPASDAGTALSREGAPGPGVGVAGAAPRSSGSNRRATSPSLTV